MSLRCATVFVTALLLFFFNDTATTEIYTLSLHDALPIFDRALLTDGAGDEHERNVDRFLARDLEREEAVEVDRKSTRLNSSHSQISYAVFCLKKKKTQHNQNIFRTTSASNNLSHTHLCRT